MQKTKAGFVLKIILARLVTMMMLMATMLIDDVVDVDGVDDVDDVDAHRLRDLTARVLDLESQMLSL